MLVRKLEYRSRLVSDATVVAIFYDGRHRDPGPLARWNTVMSPRLVQKSSGAPAAGDFTISAPKVRFRLVSFGKEMWFDEER